MNEEVDKVYWKLIVGIILICIIYLYAQNNWHEKTTYKIHLSKRHSKLNGKRIIFLSDTHFKESTSLVFLDRILVDIEQNKPDVIIFGGNIIHSANQEKVLEHTKDFFYQLNKIAPTYLVFGDRDLANEQLSEIKRVLKLSGAKVLSNQAEWISFGDAAVGFWLMGLCEQVVGLNQKEDPLSKITLPPNSKKEMKLLIAHYPEYFERYLLNEETRPNLILSGHTLGGQVILPMVGGLYASNQGLNPTYDFGVFASHQHPDSRMIITSGIGNADFPIRVNNRPEIVLIELE